MNRLDAAAIALRVFSLWLGVRATQSAVQTLGMIQHNPDPPYPAYLLFLYPALVLALAVVVWMRTASLARLVLPRSTDDDSIGPWTREDAALVAFAAVGVYFVGASLSRIAYWVFFMRRSTALRPDMFEASPSMIGSMAAAVVELIVGLLLLFGGRGWIRLLRSTRSSSAED